MLSPPLLKNDNIYSSTKYNINFFFILTAKDAVFGGLLVTKWAISELDFISSRAGRQRHWDQVQRGWSPQIWKSSGEKQGSGGWWQHCTLCWA
jgi:hypothetical protein